MTAIVGYAHERLSQKYIHFCWLLHFVVNGRLMP